MYGTKKLCTLAFRLSNRERWYKRFLTMPSINGRKRWAPEETLPSIDQVMGHWIVELLLILFCVDYYCDRIVDICRNWRVDKSFWATHFTHGGAGQVDWSLGTRWMDIQWYVRWGREIKWMVAKSRLMLHGPRFVLSCLVSFDDYHDLPGWLDQSVSSRCIPLGPPYMFHLKLG